jgi:hypothetical protein
VPRFAVGLESSILTKMRLRRSSLRSSRRGTALMIRFVPPIAASGVTCPMSQPQRGAPQKLASVNQSDDSVASYRRGMTVDRGNSRLAQSHAGCYTTCRLWARTDEIALLGV